MFEYEASLALRVEILETALTALFETLPTSHPARARFMALMEDKLGSVGFAHERRHQLERVIERLSSKFEARAASDDPS